MDCLKIIQWNCRSVSGKIDWMKTCPFSNADILVFQETFLKDYKSFHIPNKIVYRSDRNDRPGGGLLIAVKNSIASTCHPKIFKTRNTEIMNVSVSLDSFNLNIINVYSNSDMITEELNSFCHDISGPVLILGDFNLHHPLWGSAVSSRSSENFVHWLSTGDYCILNTSDVTHVSPNGSSSLIDLSLCSACIFSKMSISVDEDLYESDHFPIHLAVTIHPRSLFPRLRYRWAKIIDEVNAKLFPFNNISYVDFLEVIKNAMEHNSFNFRPMSGNFPVWWSNRCNNLYLQKKFLLRKAIRQVSASDWDKYRRISAKLRRTIKETKRGYWSRVCSDASDPYILFRVFKNLRSRTCISPDSHLCLNHNGSLIYDAVHQAEIFADHYSNVVNHVPIPMVYGPEETSALNKPFTIDELTEAINKTKNSAPGEDGIRAVLFKGLDDHSRLLLLHVYNDIWNNGDIPKDWSTAIVLPLLKPGKPAKNPSSYRPIALTSVMAKICERMIAKRLNDYILNQRILHPRHFGFVNFRDCQTALATFYYDLQYAIRHKKYFFGVSLDLKGAYDSVYIDGLIYKCAQLGITGRILRWLHNFLNNRSIKISWRNRMSTLRCLDRGTPQGAVLSPVMFTIFMCDFFETIGPNVRSLIYADDIFIYSICDSFDVGRIHIQDTLRNVSRWCDHWKMQISSEKSIAVDLSRRAADHDFHFYINNGRIQWSSSLKFLGFFFSRRGGFRRHVDYVRNKAFNRLNILKALASKNYGARSLQLLFLARSSICSLVDHGAVILSDCSYSLLKRLEVINSSSIRIALGLPRWTPILVLYKHAGFPPIEMRIKDRAFKFWIKHISLGSWSPIGSSLCPSVVEDVVAPVIPKFVEDYLADRDCRLDGLIPFIFPCQPPSGVVSFLLSGLPFQRTDLNEQIVNTLFLEFLHSQDGFLEIIATDASKSSGKTTIAGCTGSGSFGYIVNQINSVFTAEALAIGVAFDELVPPACPIMILSDSLSVLSALQAVSLSSPRIILWLHAKVYNAARFTNRILLCWVPGHRGIPLNERADSLAKSVGDTDVMLDWIGPEDVICGWKKDSVGEFGRQFAASKYGARLGNIPSIKDTNLWVNSRKDDVLVSRLLCGMLITPQILCRFKLITNDRCGECHVADSMEHIILECKKYDRQRVMCFKDRASSVYFCSLVDFLRWFCVSAEFRNDTIDFLRLIDRF